MQWAAPWQSLKLPFQQLISYASLKRSVLSVSLSLSLYSFSLLSVCLSVCLSATPLALSLIRFAYCRRVRCLLSSCLHVQIRKVVQLPFIIRSVVQGVCGVMRVCASVCALNTKLLPKIDAFAAHTRAHMLNATDQNAQRATFCYACAGAGRRTQHTRRMTVTQREKEEKVGVYREGEIVQDIYCCTKLLIFNLNCQTMCEAKVWQQIKFCLLKLQLKNYFR